jgi:serine/threonine-protein kinase HipA
MRRRSHEKSEREEVEKGGKFVFAYRKGYGGPPVSLTMPVEGERYEFDGFPAFFDGLLPEGEMLEGLLRQAKIDRNDNLGQLLAVGGDLVGAVTVEAAAEDET